MFSIAATLYGLIADPQNLLKLPGPIYNYLTARKYSAQIKETSVPIKAEISSLEDALLQIQTDIYKNKPQNWQAMWKLAGALVENLDTLATEAALVRQHEYKTWRERAAGMKAKAAMTKELSSYVQPLRQAVLAVRQEPWKLGSEFGGMSAYVSALSELRRQNAQNFGESLKAFEAEHAGTAIAKACKKQRLALVEVNAVKYNEPEIDSYIGSVRTKMAGHAPVWSPLGYIFEDKSKWGVKADNARKISYVQTERFGHPLVVSCEYVPSTEFGKINLMGTALKARRVFRNAFGKYEVKAFVTETAPQDFVERVAGFEDTHMAAFLYETSSKRLTCNEKLLAVNAFKGYFSPIEVPESLVNILKRCEKDGRVLESGLRADMRLNSNEITKVVRHGLLSFDEPGKYLLNQESPYFGWMA